MRLKKLDGRKKKFLKRFSIVFVLYIWLSFTIGYDGEMMEMEKVAWMGFLFLCMDFTYRGLDLIDRINCMIEEERRMKNDNPEIVMEETA